MADEITTPTVGIFAGGKTEVTVNGITYTGTSYSSLNQAYVNNDIAVVQDRTITGRTALRTANRTLILDNVTANGCTGGNGGMFINNENGKGNTIEVYNATISDCGNSQYGGVVYSNTDSSFTFNNAVFSRNIAQNAGGAFYLTGNREITTPPDGRRL
jgi:predicted outer membrane repeat protein